MRQRLLTIIALGWTLGSAWAQSALSTASVEHKPDYFRLQGNEISINFSLRINKWGGVNKQQLLTLTPVVQAHSGEASKALTPVVVAGKVRARMEARKQLGMNREEKLLAGSVTPITAQAGDTVNYSLTLPYEPWMENADLVVLENISGCRCQNQGEGEETVLSPILYQPDYTTGELEECPVEYNPRTEKRDAYLIYKVDKTDLRPDLYGNDRELRKIDEAIRLVGNDPHYEIQQIDITGFASPEAPYEHNVMLAEGRAAALKNYVKNTYRIPDSLMRIMPGAENWGELAEMLKNMQIGYKEEILELMETVEDPDEREERIKRVGGGTPYQLMYNTIYPHLRKNTFTITYISRERPVEEAHELVFSKPQELNTYEFYRVAETYYKDNPEKYAQVLMLAADTYPDHAVANSNAAKVALQQGLTGQAEHYLQQTGNEPYTWNTRGMLSMQRGDVKDAAFWWKKAAAAGDRTAAHNMKKLNRRGY